MSASSLQMRAGTQEQHRRDVSAFLLLPRKGLEKGFSMAETVTGSPCQTSGRSRWRPRAWHVERRFRECPTKISHASRYLRGCLLLGSLGTNIGSAASHAQIPLVLRITRDREIESCPQAVTSDKFERLPLLIPDA
jgi:hypothetical protein